MTSDHLALTSDGVKYSPVAVGEDDDRDEVVPAQTNHRKRLQLTQSRARLLPYNKSTPHTVKIIFCGEFSIF